MNKHTVVPEVHDIGKLVDKDWIKNFISQKLSILPEKIDWDHDFLCKNNETEKYLDYLRFFGDIFNETPTYEIIRYHHNPPPKQTKNIFLACVADHMASSISRTLTIREMEKIRIKSETKNLSKLWKPSVKKISLISSEKDFKHLIEFINAIQNKEQYIQEFYDKLLERPEDFQPPKNITSLLTHSKLVGKLYRFFEENITETPNGFEFGGQIRNSTKDAEEKWLIKIILGRIKFSHYPVRVKDLNIFEILNNEVNTFSKYDNVILNTSSQFLAILAPNASVAEFVKPFVNRGFFVTVEEAKTEIKNAYLTPDSIRKLEYQTFEKQLEKNRTNFEKIPDKHIKDKKLQELNIKQLEFEKRFRISNVYGILPITVDKLCEICQMEYATIDWFDEDSGITEHICKNCYSIRKYSEMPIAPKIDLWYKEEPYSKIAWIKINLDIELLSITLEELLKKYIQDITESTKDASKDVRLILDEIKLRFSVLAEFQQDFNSFIKDFNNKLEQDFNKENFQHILDDFICVKLDKTGHINDILDVYNNLFTKYFPKLKDQKSPITFSASVSSAKFAFFRHWNFLENPTDDINIVLIGKGEMHISLNQLEEIMKIRLPSSKQLHKLAKISETSEKLAKVLVYDRGDYRVYNELEPFRGKDKTINFKTILTYTKMLEETDEFP